MLIPKSCSIFSTLALKSGSFKEHVNKSTIAPDGKFLNIEIKLLEKYRYSSLYGSGADTAGSPSIGSACVFCSSSGKKGNDEYPG